MNWRRCPILNSIPTKSSASPRSVTTRVAWRSKALTAHMPGCRKRIIGVSIPIWRPSANAGGSIPIAIWFVRTTNESVWLDGASPIGLRHRLAQVAIPVTGGDDDEEHPHAGREEGVKEKALR